MHLYNTLTGKKEPLDEASGKISLYVCGITPYDTTHLGHAFTYVFFDTLVRFLRFKGFKVIYTQNVTDVDDPLFAQARKLKINWQEIANRYTARFLKDMKFLNVSPADYFPKVSEEIPMIISVIKGLFAEGLAYKRGNRIYFDVKKDKEYGKLSKLTFKKMVNLSRKRGGDSEDVNKKHPLDFILWKASEKDEPSWMSPWGYGRPGWHIECSSMAIKYLGQKVTIHGGGRDLIFPHHESEIAQSEGYTDKKPFVRYWLHSGMVSFRHKKMSKSLGNLILVSELAKKYSSAAIRLYLLSHHYRKDWEFNENDLLKTQKMVKKIAAALKYKKGVNGKIKMVTKLSQQFIMSIENDMNTKKAISYLEKLCFLPTEDSRNKLKEFIRILGLKI